MPETQIAAVLAMTLSTTRPEFEGPPTNGWKTITAGAPTHRIKVETCVGGVIWTYEGELAEAVLTQRPATRREAELAGMIHAAHLENRRSSDA